MRTPRVHRGELKEKIVLKAVNPTTDSMGGVTEGTPTTVATMWAKVSPLTGTRAMEYQQLTGSQGYIIVFNYRDDITIDNKNIITWNSKDLTVHSVKMTDENRRQFEILAHNKI